MKSLYCFQFPRIEINSSKKFLKKIFYWNPVARSQFHSFFNHISFSFYQFKVKKEKFASPLEKLQTGNESFDCSKNKTLVTFSDIRGFNRASSEYEKIMRRFPNVIVYELDSGHISSPRSAFVRKLKKNKSPQTSQQSNSFKEATFASGLVRNFFSDNQNELCDRLRLLLEKTIVEMIVVITFCYNS